MFNTVRCLVYDLTNSNSNRNTYLMQCNQFEFDGFIHYMPTQGEPKGQIRVLAFFLVQMIKLYF